MIAGRVQGVGFRFFTEHAAQVEGLSGYVANRPDGRVEVGVEGDQDSVERFERAVRNGPPGARVTAIDIEGAEPSGRLTGFQIRM